MLKFKFSSALKRAVSLLLTFMMLVSLITVSTVTGVAADENNTADSGTKTVYIDGKGYAPVISEDGGSSYSYVSKYGNTDIYACNVSVGTDYTIALDKYGNNKGAVYFTKPDTWNDNNIKIYTHFWNQGTGKIAADWPGKEMNQIGDTNVYYIEYPGDNYTNVVFSNGKAVDEGGKQTINLELYKNNIYNCATSVNSEGKYDCKNEAHMEWANVTKGISFSADDKDRLYAFDDKENAFFESDIATQNDITLTVKDSQGNSVSLEDGVFYKGEAYTLEAGKIDNYTVKVSGVNENNQITLDKSENTVTVTATNTLCTALSVTKEFTINAKNPLEIEGNWVIKQDGSVISGNTVYVENSASKVTARYNVTEATYAGENIDLGKLGFVYSLNDTSQENTVNSGYEFELSKMNAENKISCKISYNGYDVDVVGYTLNCKFPQVSVEIPTEKSNAVIYSESPYEIYVKESADSADSADSFTVQVNSKDVAKISCVLNTESATPDEASSYVEKELTLGENNRVSIPVKDCNNATLTVKYTNTVDGEYKNGATYNIRVVNSAPAIEKITCDDTVWSNEKSTVSVTIKDSYRVKDDTVIATGDDGTTVAPDKDRGDNGEYIFKIEKCQNYTITYDDTLGNNIASDASKEDYTIYANELMLDQTNPVITGFELAPAATTADKVFSFLTFGLYSNDDIKVTVSAKDIAPSSGIKDITLTTANGQTIEADSFVQTKASEDSDVTASRTFTIKASELAENSIYNLKAVVTDNVDNKSAETGIFDDGVSLTIGDTDALEKILDKDTFEIVATSVTPEISDITFDGPNTFKETEAKYWYSGDVTFKFNVADELSGISAQNGISVYFGKQLEFTADNLNGKNLESLTNVTAACSDNVNIASDKKVTNVSDISYTTNGLTSGAYTLLVVATNNSGDISTQSQTVYIDTVVPEITDITYSNVKDGGATQLWTKDTVKVTFKVTDNDSGINADSISILDADGNPVYFRDSEEKVCAYPVETDIFPDLGNETGTPNEAESDLSELENNDVYYFMADKNQQYKIVVYDNVGNSSDKTTDTILCDQDAPTISNITYSNNDNEKWEKDSVTVKFTVNDDGSGVNTDSIKVVDENGEEVKVTVTNNGDSTVGTPDEAKPESVVNTVNCSFETNEYHSFTISANDNVGNSADEATTENVKIDTQAPEITGFKFEKDETSLDKVLNFLTFGLYSNGKIKVTVTAEDKYPSSGIKNITLQSKSGKPIEAKSFAATASSETAGKNVTAQRVFVLSPGDYEGDSVYQLKAQVTDNVGNESAETGIFGEGVSLTIDNEDALAKILDKDTFEIVATKATPTLSEIAVDGKNRCSAKGNTYYSDAVTFSFNVTDELSGFSDYNINGLIQDRIKVYFGKTSNPNTLSETDEVINSGEFITGSSTPDEKITSVEYTTAPMIWNRYKVDGQVISGAYSLKVVATNNSGNISTKATTVYIDTDGAVISDIAYSNVKDGEATQFWTNDTVKVTFRVTDGGSGVDEGTIKAIGTDYNGKKTTYTFDNGISKVEGTEDTYCFTADSYQRFTISADDNVTNPSSEETEYVLCDEIKPVISDVTYSNKGNEEWMQKEATVTFTVTDNDDGSCINENSLEVIGTDYAGNKKTYTISNGEITAGNRVIGINGACECTYTFKATDYQSFTINVKDNAGNSAYEATTENVKIDTQAPEITGFELAPAATPADKVFSFLTFGLYSNDDIKVTVNANDNKPSSGIKDITLTTANGKEIVPSGFVQTDPSEEGNVTASRTFTLKAGELAENSIYDLKAVVTDNVGRASDETGIDGEGVNLKFDKDSSDKIENLNDFEIISTTVEPKANDISVDGKNRCSAKGNTYYSDAVSFSFNVTDEPSGFSNDSSNGLIQDKIKVYFGKTDNPKAVATEVTNAQNFAGFKTGENSDNKITSVNYTTTPEIWSRFTTDGKVASGAYTLLVVATNNSGNTTTISKTVYIDTDGAVISDIAYSNVKDGEATQFWTNDTVKVTFRVTDNGSGVDEDTIEAIGTDYNGNEVTSYTFGNGISKVEGTEDTYCFTADSYQRFTISADDKVTNPSSEETEYVLCDEIKPVISDVTYSNKGNEEWMQKEATVTFTVTDNDDGSGIDESTLVINGTSYNNKNVSYTVGNGITAGEKTSSGIGEITTRTYSFTATDYQSFTINVKDIAGNAADEYGTDSVRVDTQAPEITGFELAPAATPADKVFSFLTFGLYSNDDIKVTVNANDNKPSSGIKDITLTTANGKEIVPSGFVQTDPSEEGNVTASRTFTLKAGELAENSIYDLKAVVTDNVDNKSAETGIDGDGVELVINKEISDKIEDRSKFEIISTTVEPKANEITVDGPNTFKETEAKYWYSGAVSFSFNVTDELSGFSNDSSNGLIQDKIKVYFDQTANLEDVKTEVTNADNFADFITGKNSDNKITSVNYTTTDEIWDRFTADGKVASGAYTLLVVATNNSGNTTTISKTVYIDTVVPVITDFTFSGGERRNSAIPIDEPVAQKMSYGYYFREDTTVTVTASDGDNADACCGVKSISFYTKDINGKESGVSVVNTTNNTAEFTIPANFKGQIFAYATDNVENTGKPQKPSDVIVENQTKHDDSSKIKFEMLTEADYSDSNRHYYKGDATVRVTVSDTYSGIERIDYSVAGATDTGNNYTGYVLVDNDGNVTDSNGFKWTKQENEKDNLVYELKSDLTVTNSDNNIVVTVTLTDRAGNTSSNTQSLGIDKTAPVIDDIKYSNNQNKEWKNENVTVTFTVTDNSNDTSGINESTIKVKGIDYSGKEVEYTVTPSENYTPGLSGIASRTYSFTATDYQSFTIDAADNVGNSAKQIKTENVKIDKINPAITGFKFEKDETSLDKVLNFLTFGLYSNGKIKVTVTAEDKYPSSGIKNITLQSKTGKPIEAKSFTATASSETAGKNVTAQRVFVLSPGDYEGDSVYQLKAQVTDNVGNKSAETGINGNGVNLEFDKASSDKIENLNDFEIVATTEKPNAGTIASTGANYVKVSGKEWYSDMAAFSFTVNDNLSGFSNDAKNGYIQDQIKVYFNKTDDPSKVTTDVTNKLNFTVLNRDNNKITQIRYTTTPEIWSRYIKDGKIESGAYTIRYAATNNSGNTSDFVSKTVYIDTDNPSVTGFTFAPAQNQYSLANTSTVKSTEYGYYFSQDTNVTFTADDASGSGVESIGFWTKNIDGTVSSVEVKSVNSANQATFLVKKEFKGEIFAYAIDKVTNNTDRTVVINPSGTILESPELHKASSSIKLSIPDTAYKDNAGLPLYNASVPVSVSVRDSYSGIAKIDYSVYSQVDPDGNSYSGTVTVNNSGKAVDSSGQLWTYTDSARDNLVYDMASTLAVANNSNAITVKVVLTDRAGNTSEDQIQFSIDKTAPEIEVTYDNNSFNTYRGTDYYKADRTATIVIKERNFTESNVNITVDSVHGSNAQLSGWTESRNEADPDSSTYTATLRYTADDDYTFDISFKDNADNQAAPFEQQSFTLDKTTPLISVSFDNTSALGGNYYKAERTATITVDEHNFADGDVKVSYDQAFSGDNSTPAAPPALLGWTSSGDKRTATIKFDKDGKYSFTVDYTDLAGNEAKQEVVTTFYVDKTNPVVEISNIEDKSANAGEVRPVITISDNNYADNYVISLERIDIEGKSSSVAGDMTYEAVHNSNKGITITYNNFANQEKYDGIYYLKVDMTDRAGNKSSDDVTFSVNRFGSTYKYGNKVSEQLIETGYSNKETDVVISEINVNNLTKKAVTLSKNSDTVQTLELDKDYTITDKSAEGKWHQYDYTVKAQNFVDEGYYTVTVNSTDAAKNSTSNRTPLASERKLPVSFVIDKTAPVVSISGIKSGDLLEENSKTVKITCEDSNMDFDSLEIRLNGNVLTDYTVEQDVASIEVNYVINATSDISAQDLEVSVKDLAGNKGKDEATGFILSATWLMRFFANTPLVICTFAGIALVIGLIVFIIVKRRKKDDEEESV